MAYGPEEKALVIAAVDRWGRTRALAFLKAEHDLRPSERAVRDWREAGIVATEAATEELLEMEGQRKSRVMAGWYGLFDKGFAAIEKAFDAGQMLGAQQGSFSLGIATDKLFGSPKTGTAVVGSAQTVIMQVVSSAAVPGAAHLSVDEVEGEVIEGESGEVE